MNTAFLNGDMKPRWKQEQRNPPLQISQTRLQMTLTLKRMASLALQKQTQMILILNSGPEEVKIIWKSLPILFWHRQPHTMEIWIDMSDSCTLEGLEAPLYFIASFAEFTTTQCLLAGMPINFKVTPNRPSHDMTLPALRTTHSIPLDDMVAIETVQEQCYMTYTPSPKKKH
ncbi:hypothetical protein N7501_010309 [Penicillium viridicatum]|nr:hypothetical protein N7501_010309 [Penicillium viridicatum]